MSLSSWFHNLLGRVETKAKEIEPEALAWAKNFLSTVTPVIRQAATDAVLTAVSVPGSGAVKATAALAAGMADLASKGIPVVEADLKAAIQVAYHALPASITGNTAAAAVETVAEKAIDRAGTSLQKDAGIAPDAGTAAAATTAGAS